MEHREVCKSSGVGVVCAVIVCSMHMQYFNTRAQGC